MVGPQPLELIVMVRIHVPQHNFMEASQSGLIINNSNSIVLSINLALKFAFIIFGGGGLIGIVTAILLKFGDGAIKEFYDRRKQAHSKKQQAAQDITSFCIEGMHCGFKHKAGSERAIKFRAAEIESIDTEVGVKLRNFLGSWSMYRNFIKDKQPAIQDEALAIEYKNKAQKLGDELLAIAKKWAK